MPLSSLAVGFCPRDLIMVANSVQSMEPSPSRSNNLNASLYSENHDTISINHRNSEFKLWTFNECIRAGLTV